jgi:hypothetical protein
MKIALLATALFWLIVWGAVAWRVGVSPGALALFALVIVAYGALGVLGLGASRQRFLAAGGALALAILVAVPTFLDARLLVGGLAVAAAAAMAGDPTTTA